MFAGLILISQGFELLPDAQAFFSDSGALPRKTALETFDSERGFSLMMAGGSTFYVYLLLVLQILFGLLLFLGCKTRLATLACLLLIVSQVNRNHFILDSSDFLLANILLLAVFIPWGAYFSVDAGLDRGFGRTEKPVLHGSAATACLLVLMFFLYLVSGVAKYNPHWFSGKAMIMALQYESLSTGAGLWLRDFLADRLWAARFFSNGTLVVEVLFPFCFLIFFGLPRIRFVLGFVFVMFHLGTLLFFRIGYFPAIASIFWVAAVPSPFWRWAYSRKNKPESVTVHYDADCGFCKKSVYVLCSLLGIEKTGIRQAQSDPVVCQKMLEENSWVVQSANGRLSTGYAAFLRLAETSPFIAWMMPVLDCRPARFLGQRVYVLVSANRSFLSRLTAPMNFSGMAFKPGPAATAFLLMHLVILTETNLANLGWFDSHRRHFPQIAKASQEYTRFLGIVQDWKLFSPYPTIYVGWFMVKGYLSDGRQIDILNDRPVFSEEKPGHVAAQFENSNWFKYYTKLWLKKNSDYRVPLLRFLCKDHNRNLTPGEAAMRKIELYFFLEKKTLNLANQPNLGLHRIAWLNSC